MLNLKEYSLKDTGSVALILFSSLYLGVGIALFQIFSSDFKEFNSPFLNPLIASFFVPALTLVLPAIILTAVFVLLNLLNKKVSSLFLIIIISICIILYIFRAYYLINATYLDSILLITFFAVFVFIIVLNLNHYVFNFFQILTLISVSMTSYFCYEYYNYLKNNRTNTSYDYSETSSDYKLGNTDTPVFIIIFDELSLYLVLNEEGGIDENLFPELKEFSNMSTWYPNSTTQISDTLVSRSSLYSGYNYFKDCKGKPEYCEHKIVEGLIKAKHPVKSLLKLNGIDPKVNNMDKWYSLDRVPSDQKYGTSSNYFLVYINKLIDIYLLAVLTPNWSARLQNIETQLNFSKSSHAEGAVLEGSTESYGFLKCAFQANRSIKRFNLFIDRIDPEVYLINSILTNLTHAPFCFDDSGMVEVIYPLRIITEDDGKTKYYPDTVAMADYIQSTCTNDEIPFNVRRSRINQSMLAMKLFNKTLKKIKDIGIFDRSLIIVMSDHGVGFLGPSFGRGNHMLRRKDDILDNRMMNASILLMIKYPHQVQTEVDYRMARPMDVGATLIDILKFEPPWTIDGQSLISDDWKEVLPPLDFYQLLYKNNSWSNNMKIWVGGDVIEPLIYFDEFKKKANSVTVLTSKWIGTDVAELPLSKQKSGKLEYLKIEKALPTENKGDYVLTLGGYSYDPSLNPSSETYIAVDNKIIKSIKPCLSFSKDQHKMGDILGGWVVTVPRDIINSRKLNFRAFSPVGDSEDELFYELENPINIELTEKQFLRVGNVK